MIDERFQRTRLLLGEENFSKLQAATVAVFGLGGVGSFTAEALARAGIGHLILIDKDNVDVTNINRQLPALTSTIGKPKVQVLRERVFEINPAAKVDIIQKFYLPEEPAENFFICQYDYVVDAIDTITAKINLAAECQAREIPLISSMGAGNKLDPTLFRVADIYKTKIDPVAKVMRKKLKERGVYRLKVVYSEEEPKKIDAGDLTGKVIGSVSFVPSVAGLILASQVVRDLIGGFE